MNRFARSIIQPTRHFALLTVAAAVAASVAVGCSSQSGVGESSSGAEGSSGSTGSLTGGSATATGTSGIGGASGSGSSGAGRGSTGTGGSTGAGGGATGSRTSTDTTGSIGGGSNDTGSSGADASAGYLDAGVTPDGSSTGGRGTSSSTSSGTTSSTTGGTRGTTGGSTGRTTGGSTGRTTGGSTGRTTGGTTGNTSAGTTGGTTGTTTSGTTGGTTGGSIGTPNVTIDTATQYQTIDGFGFFGAQTDWWGQPSDLWSDTWGTQVIHDLGITMWRTEYYSEEPNQDANWAKELPVVQGLKKIADANRVPLKFIFTVWTPPSSMKCTVDSVQSGTTPCTPNPDGLKNGGTLDPSKYDDYAQWLIQGIKNYADAGVDLYALSPQNEPMFVEPYNSCVYDIDPAKLNAYSRMLEAIAPAIKKAYPNVKIFGTENMLGLEGQQWFYSANMDSAAWQYFDVLAYHGYQDGVAPTASSQLATYWNYVRTNWDEPHGKSGWMTETSGYTDTWDDTNGARTLAFAIYSALYYGHASAWVWWQGSELGGPPNQYALMGGTQYLGKRYFVSKNFYRYIRPGAKMVKVTSSDSSIFAVAFVHPTMNSFTVVAINTATSDKTLVLGGPGVPSTFQGCRTSSSENCIDIGTVTNGSITLKADSITTLVNGNVYE